MRAFVVVLLTLLLPHTSLAEADMRRVIESVHQWREANAGRILDELVQFVSIPNETRARTNILRNARHLVAMMEARGLSPRLLEVAGSAPVVYGEWRVPDATRTYVFYADYDGQPIGEAKDWASPPYEPTLCDGRIEAGGHVVSPIPLALSGDRDWHRLPWPFLPAQVQRSTSVS